MAVVLSQKTGPPLKVVLGGLLSLAIIGPHQRKPIPPKARAIFDSISHMAKPVAD